MTVEPTSFVDACIQMDRAITVVFEIIERYADSHMERDQMIDHLKWRLQYAMQIVQQIDDAATTAGD